MRDKDGVAAALLVCGMAAYHKAQGSSLSEALSKIYAQYGYEKTKLRSFTFEGASGRQKIESVMKAAREKDVSLAPFVIRERIDYSLGISDLPKTDALKFSLDQGSVIIRPSGTEPKLKIYICGIGDSEAEAEQIAQKILYCVETALGLDK